MRSRGAVAIGFGDDIMVTGYVKEAWKPGFLCVSGDPQTKKIFTSPMFHNNPKMWNGGQVRPNNLIWVEEHPGKREYIIERVGQKIIYNTEHRAKPGELFLTDEEKAKIPQEKYIYIEPNIKTHSEDGSQIFPIGFNKNWGWHNWEELAKRLSKDFKLIQCGDTRARNLPYATKIQTNTFREALPYIKGAELVITIDGGVHHASAALDRKAVVVWGEVTTPVFLGYESHRNIWLGEGPCGSISRCQGCKEAMKKISVDMVEEAVRSEI